MPRASLSNPVDREAVLSAKHTTHGTAIKDLISPSETVILKGLLRSLGVTDA